MFSIFLWRNNHNLFDSAIFPFLEGPFWNFVSSRANYKIDLKKLKSLKGMLMETGIHKVFKIFEESKCMEVYFYWRSWIGTSSRKSIKNFPKIFGNAACNYKVNNLCLNHIWKTFTKSCKLIPPTLETIKRIPILKWIA